VSLGFANPLLAELDFVTDPAVCDLELFERQERAMTFDGSDFWEIEYHCEVEPITPPDWTSDQTQIRAGYCEEPGYLYPGVFVFRSHPGEPGKLYVYQDESGEAVIYHSCKINAD